MEGLIRLLFDRRPGGTELLMLRQNHAEHLDRLGLLRHREAHTLTCREIEIVEKPTLINLAPDNRPCLLLKRLAGVAGNGGRTGETVE